MTHGHLAQTLKFKLQTHTHTHRLANPTCTVQRQTPVCESMGVSNERLNLNLRSTKEDKKKHAHTRTHRIKVIYFPLWKKQKKERLHLYCHSMRPCVCVAVEASAWKLIIVVVAVPANHTRLSANDVGRCRCKHRNYLLISAQLYAHLCPRLPLPHLSSPITPLLSPQPSARWKPG